MKRAFYKNSDLLFNIIIYTILTIVLITILYPLYFVVIASISDPNLVNTGKVLFIPKGLTLEGYKNVFAYSQVWSGYRNTILYTLCGTFLNVIVTIMFAYALSRKIFSGRKVLMIYLLITMYFNGGLIPTYLVVQSLGLYDTPLVIILIGLVTGTNVVIAKTYLQDNIPDGIYESAVMDGCNHFLFVWKMVFPLSKALIAVLALYYGIVHWNDFFNALIYLDNSDLMPLQIVLRSILLQNQATADVAGLDDAYQKQQTMELMKYSLIIVATIPMLIAYPFFQRYFVQGVTVGAVKG